MTVLWKIYMLMNYRKKKEKAMILFPAYSKALFLLTRVLKYAFIFSFLGLVAIIGKEKYEVALLTEVILLFFFLLQAILVEGAIDAFDNEYGLIKHFLSGMYSDEEKKKIHRKLILLIGWDRVGVFVCGEMVFFLAEMLVYHKNAIVLVAEIIAITALFIARARMELIRRVEGVNEKSNWLFFSVVAFGGCMALRLGLFQKWGLPKSTEEFLSMISIGQSNGAFLGFVLLCGLCCLLTSLTLLKRGNSAADKRLFEGIHRHFFEIEIKGKIPFFFAVCATIFWLSSSWIQMACSIAVVSAFLFSVFNNRFLLGKEYLFASALSNPYGVVCKLAKTTVAFPVVSVAVGCLIAIPFSHMFAGVIVAELVVLLTMVLQAATYRIGCRAIRDCLPLVEYIGGGIYIAQLFVIVALL